MWLDIVRIQAVGKIVMQETRIDRQIDDEIINRSITKIIHGNVTQRPLINRIDTQGGR